MSDRSTSSTANHRLPLTGLRVLDLASMVAGPYGATLLGDFGADVVKIEPPRGEDARWFGPQRNGTSAAFVGINRNKRSVVLDLASPDGRDALTALIAWADVTIDNLRPSARLKLGLDYETQRAVNPSVIAVNVSTFGTTGPYAGRPGIDPVVQAISGFMAVTGFRDGPPIKAGPPVADAVSSLLVAYGALTAVWARERTGEGQSVEVALIDGLIHIQATYAAQHFLMGDQQPRTGNASEWYTPYNTYQCNDGSFVHIACYNDRFFGHLCNAMSRPELAADPRFHDNESRLNHRDGLDLVVADFCRGLPRDELLRRLHAHDVIVGPVYSYAEALEDPQVIHNEMVVEVDHHTGPLKVTGVPIRLGSTPGSVRLPPPELGDHTREVLTEVGVDERLVERLCGR